MVLDAMDGPATAAAVLWPASGLYMCPSWPARCGCSSLPRVNAPPPILVVASLSLTVVVSSGTLNDYGVVLVSKIKFDMHSNMLCKVIGKMWNCSAIRSASCADSANRSAFWFAFWSAIYSIVWPVTCSAKWLAKCEIVLQFDLQVALTQQIDAFWFAVRSAIYSMSAIW